MSMEQLSLPKQVKASENVLFQEINGEYVLLNMESEQYFGLDEVGARIWEGIMEDTNPSVVLEQLENEYDVDPTSLRQDYLNLIEEMKAENLVVIEE